MFSRWVVVLAVVFVPLLVIAEKQLVFVLIRQLHSRGYGLRNVLVYGAGLTGRRVFSAILRSPKLGMSPVAVVDDDEKLAGHEIYDYGYKRERSAQVIAGPLTSEPDQGVEHQPRRGRNSVVIARNVSRKLRTRPSRQGPTWHLFPSCRAVRKHRQTTWTSTACSSLPWVSPSGSGCMKPLKRLVRLCPRTRPCWCSRCRCGRFLPPSFAWIQRARRSSARMRVGRAGRLFNLYKFRTMRMDAPKYGLHPADADDPRITRIGRWLRRTSLDELPQLINVLKGDMSLVGPRPEMPFIVRRYNVNQRQRLRVTPGLTGLWQLSADRSFLIHENIQYDLYYIRHRNFFMDLAILLHTVVFAMKGM